MPADVRFSLRARTWLRAETSYLAERNPSAARRFVERILRASRQLADVPQSGSPGPVPGTRRLVVASYVLTSRRRAAGVEIIDIRHGRQSAPDPGQQT